MVIVLGGDQHPFDAQLEFLNEFLQLPLVPRFALGDDQDVRVSFERNLAGADEKLLLLMEGFRVHFLNSYFPEGYPIGVRHHGVKLLLAPAVDGAQLFGHRLVLKLLHLFLGYGGQVHFRGCAI